MIKMSLRQAIAAYQALDEFPRVADMKISYELGYIAEKLEQRVRVLDTKGVDTRLSDLKRKIVHARYGIDVEIVS